MRRVEGTFRLVKLAFIIFSAIILMVSFNVLPTFATDDATFATIRGPAGVSGGFDSTGVVPRLYITPNSNPRRIMYVDSNGHVRRFHTLPNRSGGFKDDIAVAPGGKLEEFGENFVYVTQGAKIYKIAPDGKAQRDPFAIIPGCQDPSTEITFDDIGDAGVATSFGNDMIATCNYELISEIWRINSSGTPSLVAITSGGPLPNDIRGPDVAPESFVPCPGCVLVASPSTGVLGVTAGGAVSVVAANTSWMGAKTIHTIPPVLCEFGKDPKGVFFMARSTQDEIRVLRATTTSSAPFANNIAGAVVTFDGLTGNASLIRIISKAGAFDQHILMFAQNGGDSDFCPRRRVKIFIKPGTFQKYEPDTSNGRIPVVILGSENFNVTQVNQDASLKFGATGTESSWSHCDGFSDQNGDGYLDLKCHFRWSQTELTPTSTQAVLTGIQNPPFEAFD